MRRYWLFLSAIFIILSLLVIGCSKTTTTSISTTTELATTAATSTTTKPATTATTYISNATTTSSITAKYGGTLRVAANDDGVNIGYPAKLLRASANRVDDACTETLFHFDKGANLVPWLATGYKEDPTSKTVTLTLRQGVKFHDGTDFNADAVKWNLTQFISQNSSTTAMINSIDVVDPYTVRINLSKWDSTFTPNLARTTGMMISPTACQKNGVDWACKNPIGTGPFKFVSWVPTVKVVFQKFTDYWQKGKPYLDSIEWTPIVDDTSREMSFKAGEADIVYNIVPTDWAALQKMGFILYTGNVGCGAAGLIPNSVDPDSPFSNIKVRQAAQYSLDTVAINNAVFAGVHSPANQWIYKGHWAYNPNVVGYPYDVNKSKQLLAEAGYSNGFQTQIITMQASTTLFTAVAGYLKAVGIGVTIQGVQTTQNDQLIYGGKWTGLLNAITSMTPDPVSELNRWIATKAYSQMALPPEYTNALQSAITATDFNTKQKSTQDLMKIMSDQYCMMLFIYNMVDGALTQPYVKDAGLYSTADAAFYDLADCWLNK